MTETTIPLGKTDIQISPLGVGAWAWGDRQTWGFGKGYGESDVRAAFDASIAGGINWVDTAEVYGFGLSERLVGQFIRESHPRVLTATKFFPLPWRWRRKNLLNALHASLGRLGLEHADLYQIHWPLPPVAIETWMEGLADAVEAGLTRGVGVSNYNVQQTRRAHAALARRGIPLASNQVRYSLLDRGPERSGLVKLCQELGVTIIAYSPIAQGALTGKYTPQNPPPGRRGKKFNRQYLERIHPLMELLNQFGSAHGSKTPSQVSLNWLMCKGTVPIPGAKSAKQAQENAGALGWRLADAEVAALDRASDPF